MSNHDFHVRQTAIFSFLAILVFFVGCASQPVSRSLEGDTWKGRLSGMIEGEIEVVFAEEADDPNRITLVSGMLRFDIDKVAGGYGPCTGQMKVSGKVKDGIFKSTSYGSYDCSESSGSLKGTMVGTISKTQGFGTWKFVPTQASEQFTGEWMLEKSEE